jgi:hypothetical protein
MDEITDLQPNSLPTSTDDGAFVSGLGIIPLLSFIFVTVTL